MFVTFLSDFGLQDDFVGTCHGVIKSIAPEVEIIDVTHGISPQHVLQGALVLANTTPYMPAGVHLAVVDPGIAAVHELANADYALDIVSRTFHGRDLFAPAAAHLASGVELELLGPPVAVDALARLDLPEPEIGENRIHATVLYIDRFGNVQLNLTREHLQRAEVPPGTVIEIELGLDRYYAVVARTFADARKGDVILYEDSYRNIALAISGGNAAELFGAAPGQEVRIRLQAV
ncbi:MAG: hypothetical protein AUG88_06340 [Actinobacteria bacterium 13_1_20CM_4_68_12]|nr:MAG: hypothetical protein AUG88_06340 [Actinobacteria bacterium 13_1_20CM_4_68_12]